jgi:hypothetical protein
MAVGTDSSHSRSILVVNTLLVFLVNLIHLVARSAEPETVGLLDNGVKPAPEQNSKYCSHGKDYK